MNIQVGLANFLIPEECNFTELYDTQNTDLWAGCAQKKSLAQGIINSIKGRIPKVKILGSGQISKKLIIENCKVSEKARLAIEKAGGTIK